MIPKNVDYTPIKKSEMEKGITYLLCPDKNCDGFWHERDFPCEYHCPKIESLKKILFMGKEENLVILPGDHSCMQRVEWTDRLGRKPFTLRSSYRHHLMYEMPTEN
jgi:hypothetical protein